jgi:hypothetical protein
MAVAVDFREFAPVDSRGDLVRRVEQAPIEHAEAVLAAYDLLQRLHKKGLLDLLNGLLSAGDTVVNHVVDVVSSKEMVTALRIGLIFSNLLDLVHAMLCMECLLGLARRLHRCWRLGGRQHRRMRAAAWRQPWGC